MDTIPAQPTPRKARLLPKRHTSLGWSITEIGFEHVPGYDLEEAKRGLSPQAIQTELYRNWQASTGKSVFPEFSAKLHVTELQYDPERPLIVGLDMPGTPAAVVTQIDAFGRWCVLSNLAPPDDESIGVWEFGEALALHLLREYAEPNGKDLDQLAIRFYGDPAGNVPLPKPGQAPKEARSCFDILRRGVTLNKGHDELGREVIEEKAGWGWNVMPGAVSINSRLEAVRARLTTILRDGVPAFAVDPKCRTLIEGLSGAYAYRQRSDGRYELDPDKNWHSHVCDSLSYPATRLFVQREKDDRDRGPKRQQRSRAASRAVRYGL